MNIAMVGLGRMGLNMARRLARGGVAVTAYNRTVQKAHDFAAEEGGSARAVDSIPDLVAALPTPRLVWLMLPAGAATASRFTSFCFMRSSRRPGQAMTMSTPPRNAST